VIRINLLNNYSSSSVSPTGTVAPTPGAETAIAQFRDAGFTPDLLVKIVMALVPFLLVMSYDYYAANMRQSALAAANAELTDARQKLESLKPQVEAVQKFQENKKKLQSKIDVIRSISRERLKNVKALDALQTIIPPKVWLRKLVISDNRISFDGNAVEDIDVSSFMQGLEESVFFANVTLKIVESEKTKEGVTKKFSIEANLENM
jgi:Tfp pilus assembly protein PilN